jgi:hypothetical protein
MGEAIQTKITPLSQKKTKNNGVELFPAGLKFLDAEGLLCILLMSAGN